MARITTPTLGSLGDSAGITAYGLAAIIAWLWFPYRALIIAGAIVAALGGASLIKNLRRGRSWREQDVLIRKLWTAAKRLPSDVVLADPDSGDLITIERERSWLTLAVTDAPASGTQAVVTRYPLGRWAAPNQPPVHRHMGGLGDPPPARWRWQQRWQLDQNNQQSGALEVSAGELSALIAQLGRVAIPVHSQEHAE
jgi:hypothetical protein